MSLNLGVIVVKPSGMLARLDILLEYLLSDAPALKTDAWLWLMREQLLSSYSIADRDKISLFLDNCRIVKSKQIRNELPLSYFQLNYAIANAENPMKFELIVNSYKPSPIAIFVISNNTLDRETFYKTLKLLKGKTTLVCQNNINREIVGDLSVSRIVRKNHKDMIVRPGFGLRSLFFEIETCIDLESLPSNILAEVRTYDDRFLSLNCPAFKIPRVNLSKKIDNLIFTYMPPFDNIEQISDSVHTTDSIDITNRTIKIVEEYL